MAVHRHYGFQVQQAERPNNEAAFTHVHPHAMHTLMFVLGHLHTWHGMYVVL